MFRILVVDDSPSVEHILREVAKDLRQPVELAFVADGEEALDFLHRRGAYAEARLPHLVLLDVNMPRLGGLATLSAIKADPELRMIPVIMFSTTTSPEDLRRSYRPTPTVSCKSLPISSARQNSSRLWRRFG